VKIAVAQLNAKIGDIQGNKKKILEELARARKEKADLFVTPELAVMGYPPRDLLDYRQVVEANLTALKEIQESTQGITAVIGFVEINPKPEGKPYFNSAAVFRDKKQVLIYRKRLLPYYDVFEDERYFEAGDSPGIFTIGQTRVGLGICEDIWNEEGFLRRAYKDHPIHELQDKIDLFVGLSASPFHLNKPQNRLDLVRKITGRLHVPAVFCNSVGAHDEILFDGGSFLMSQKGEILATAPSCEEALKIWDTSSQDLDISPWPTSDGEWLFETLSLGIRDYMHKTGMKRAILGLSGGIDSSVVAALAVKALGPENVLGILLPTRFTSSFSNDDAVTLASRLGMAAQVCPIDSLFGSFEGELVKWLGRKAAPLTLENIQPRLRMTVLMALANEEGRALLNTSNKSEISTGFATLYGDSSGALAVIGDLTKEQVYSLAKYINSAGEMIPARVLTRAPSAELRSGQVDQDVLPPYEELDEMVRLHVEKQVPPDRWGSIPEESKKKFLRMHAVSEFKRRQLPPVIRVSPRAFGVGRRIPIASAKTGEN
jgi:NAD+ synthase (glutamine-hydrolysing)